MIHTKPAPTDRRRAGLSIAAARDAVVQIAADQWQVASQSGHAPYTVTLHTNPDGDEAWECDCPDHRHRENECKHIHATQDTRRAMEFAIEKFVVGELDEYRDHLLRRLLSYQPDEQADRYRVLWLATETILARAQALR